MPRRSSFILPFLCLSALVAVSNQSRAEDPKPAPHFPTSEDLRHTRSISAPKLSPDGNSVLLRVIESTADGGKAHFWLVDIQSNTSRQLTYSPDSDKRGENSAEWMPDGSSILFLAHRGEHTQLFRLPMHGGEATPYDLKTLPAVDASKERDAIPPAKKTAAKPSAPEPLPIDVASFKISPDGKTVALLAKDPETPGEKKQTEAKADAVFVDHDLHATRLYLLDLATSKLTPASVPPDVDFMVFSNSSAQLVVLTEAPNNLGDLGPARSAYLLERDHPDQPKKIAAIPPTIAEEITFTPDGKQLLFGGQAKLDAPPGVNDLYVFTLADNSIHNLTDGFKGSVGRGEPFFDPDGKSFIAPISLGFRETIARFSLQSGSPTPLPFATPIVSSLHTNATRSGWVYLASSSTQPPTLCYAATLKDPCRPLAAPTPVPAEWQSVASQTIHWKSDGLNIEGLLYLPPAAKTPVPLIIDVHGGPTGAFTDRYDPFVNFFIGHGWAILRPNPRGSSNYGAAFAAANKNDLGGGDYRDIMAGLDYVLAHFPIDKDRLGLMGYSYGGEMAGFVEGKTDRFKAIVSGAPVIDQFSEYGTESGSWYDRWFFGKPWRHQADAWRQSPLSLAAHAKTPFLLIQGEADSTDPLGQAQEMYRALRQDGVPVEMIQYPRENHGPLATGIFGSPSPEPWHGFDGRLRITHFFEKAFGEPASAEPTAK